MVHLVGGKKFDKLSGSTAFEPSQSANCTSKSRDADTHTKPVEYYFCWTILKLRIFTNHLCMLSGTGTDASPFICEEHVCIEHQQTIDRPGVILLPVLFLSRVSIASYVVHLVEIIAAHWLFTAKLIRKYS